jgi:hypothetical protein
MQDEQKNLDRDIPADVPHLSDEDIGAWSRHFFEERGQLHQSIQNSISQGVNMEAKLTKGFVNEPYCQDSAGIERAGFLPRLLEALHHSRRLQAARVIRSYKHLIDPDCEYRLSSDPTKRSLEMSLNKAPSPATKAWFSPTVKILIAAAVVFGFVVLHIVGDEVLRSPLSVVKADMAGSNKYGD